MEPNQPPRPTPYAAQPEPQQPEPQPASPQTARKWPWVIGIIGAFFVGMVAGTGIASEDSSGAAEASDSTVVSEEPADTAAEPVDESGDEPEDDGTIGNGIHEVGVDIDPGQYKTDGPDGDGVLDDCYYARHSDDSGDFDALITNNNIQGPASLTTESGEFLELSGGCTWMFIG